MYKIGLVGKANTGKNTAGDLIISELEKVQNSKLEFRSHAFADPIKNIVKLMFPKVQLNHLYGESHFRNTPIEGAKNKANEPLTIRQVLLDIGTGVGRSYKDDIWLDCMLDKIEQAESEQADGVVITDVRFRNEFDWLKSLKFFLIKINRDTDTKIAHISETLQDEIKPDEYDFIINNDGTLDELALLIRKEVIPLLSKC